MSIRVTFHVLHSISALLSLFCLFVYYQGYGPQETGSAFDGSGDDTKPVAPEKGNCALYYLKTICLFVASL